jgi:hypothetical protein
VVKEFGSKQFSSEVFSIEGVFKGADETGRNYPWKSTPFREYAGGSV